jgi:DNA-binding Xre family transcriptional regulator
MAKKKKNGDRRLSGKRRRRRAASGGIAPETRQLIAVKLPPLLAKKHVTERELARRTGYKPRFIGEILGGKSGRLTMRGLEKILAALDVTIDRFLGFRVSKDA